MSKITNDTLTQSGTGCYIAVTIWQSSVDVKGLNKITNDRVSTTPGNR